MDGPPIPPRPPGYESGSSSFGGGGGGGPPPLPARNTPQQQQYQPQQYQQQQQQSYQLPPPQANSSQWQQSQWDQWQEFLKFQAQQQQQQQQQQSFPPPPPPRASSSSGGNEYAGDGATRAPAGFPPPPQQPPPPASAWNEHLFYSNGRETPAFEALMAEFFKRLDPQGTGYLAPEVWSSWLDVIGFSTDENVWKKSLKGNWLFKAEDLADAELKWIYEGFYFDHKTVVRDPSAKQFPHGGMPLLSLAGYTDYMAIEVAADPDRLMRGLNNALRHYAVWPEMGPIPRHVLPARCPPEVTRRLDESNARCRARAQEKLAASYAENKMKAIGQQNALDLLDDRRYVRYY